MHPELATPEVIQASQEAIQLIDALYVHNFIEQVQTIGQMVWENKEEIAGTILVGLAFSKKVRHQIARRDGYKSVLSGNTDNLEAAHISHDKSSEDYDDPSNGRLLTTAEHFWDHVNRHGTEGLGLTDSQNDWAIYQLWKRFWGIK